ncbi:MAG TPA: glucose/galactose MFS transporter [Alteromonas australica]|jgi:FHS family L-fucose permease-like MFS transporter|uniref:Glucose/galactose MFS transporter n=3 Tax=Alteromonas TaxID=226 RepID=A0A358E1R1_9ALTE|nr:glucose/galactose MFS transporter [Alteromonas sp.]QPL52095.1 sugar MFS transporter [Alteromonas sp. B31-7]HAI70976.1 glucose/galactose MFS transporter [Alteromonas australica]MAF72055.1 glucose/galactose MFS transporter [Alteromonas sp.]MBU32278.1 glucose/galactose MFS transporter [Alteromonas sp.]|tara:strand:- start:7072 stop:8238 length:1167 start_codon:yes stop_codon:yes gene_type:complete
MWGFITCLNDILIPYLKGAFSLNYTQAMLIQFCFFSAYFIVSLPAGMVVSRIGYQKGIVLGLGIACAGCLLFYPAASMGVYAIFLIALFVLAAGITILQVSANPYVTALGDPKTASSRLTMTQAFNSLGTTVAPFFGSYLIFGASGEHNSATASASDVQIPYLILATALLLLALIFLYLKLPKLNHTNANTKVFSGGAWQHRHLVLGALGIFMYVGAEVSIGSMLVNYLANPDVAGLSEGKASKLLAYFWGGAMVGRFIGALVMQKISGGKVLAFNGTMAIALIFVSISSTGSVALWAMLGVGLFNSIMFPTIFSLALQKLGKHTPQGSGILCLAIVGGAIVPLLQGVLADSVGVTLSFILPALCYVYIAYYGLIGCRVTELKTTKEV